MLNIPGRKPVLAESVHKWRLFGPSIVPGETPNVCDIPFCEPETFKIGELCNHIDL